MKRVLTKKISNYTFVGRKYKDEFRKQMRMIIVFTLGFTIAFAWRETIFEWSKNLVSWLTNSNKGGSNVWASIFITLVSVILILLTTYWLKDKNPYR